MQIIDGKKVSEIIANELIEEIKDLKEKNIVPTLAIIQVGNQPASNTYVKNKVLFSEKLKANTSVINLDDTVTNDEMVDVLTKLNNDPKINGILVQLPVPKQIDEDLIIKTISPEKDVDCFHLLNVGKLWTSRKKNFPIKPCTPAGVVELVKRSGIDLVGKDVVVMGRSNIVGKPQAGLFLLEDCSVTIVHSLSNNVKEICKRADILVVAIGRPKFINADYVNKNQVVIDVGMNRDENGKLCGDVDFENVKDACRMITPVPGGVGPMTITMLMKNLIAVTKLQNGIDND